MKKLILVLFVFFGIFAVAKADVLTLTTPEPVVAPLAVDIDWRMVTIDLANRNNILKVFYFKKNSEGQRIPMENGNVRRVWECRNRDDDPDTPEDETSTCWSDVFMYLIRCPQDEDKPIGRGLRTLIWNQMKLDSNVVGPGNDGSFDD